MISLVRADNRKKCFTLDVMGRGFLKTCIPWCDIFFVANDSKILALYLLLLSSGKSLHQEGVLVWLGIVDGEVTVHDMSRLSIEMLYIFSECLLITVFPCQ